MTQPLDLPRVKRIFTRLTLRYGAQFMNLWPGIDDMTPVHMDWAIVLGGLSDEALTFGLENLPDRPPIATAFRDICRRSGHVVKALPQARPEPDLERLEREFRRLGELAAQTKKDPKGWARRLREKDKAGEHISTVQRNAYRNALLYDDGVPIQGTFTPPAPECLPPGGLRPEP